MLVCFKNGAEENFTDEAMKTVAKGIEDRCGFAIFKGMEGEIMAIINIGEISHIVPDPPPHVKRNNETPNFILLASAVAFWALTLVVVISSLTKFFN